MQGDVNLSGEVSRPSPASQQQPGQASIIRSACESDIEAIIEMETTSFPQVYTDTGDLADYRRREIEEDYPCHRVLAASPRHSEQATIYGFITVESYLRSHREYRNPKTGEGIALPANCLADMKPAYSILMAAARADPTCYQSSPRSAYIPACGREATERDLCATLRRWPMCSP